MSHSADHSRSVIGPDADQLRLVLETTDRVERLIVQKYGVRSSRLHDQVDELMARSPVGGDDDQDDGDDAVPPMTPFVRNLHLLASVRNRLMHEPDFDRVKDLKAYNAAATAVTRQLKKMADHRDYGEGESVEELLSRRGNPVVVSAETARGLARVLGHTRCLEKLLESKFGAKGRGLEKKAQSVAKGMPASINSGLLRCSGIRNAALYAHDLSRVEELARVAERLEAELLAESPDDLRRRVEEEAAATLRRKLSLRGTIGELLADLRNDSDPQQRWWYLGGSLGWGYLAWRFYPFASCFGLAPDQLSGFAAIVVLGTLAALTLPVLLAGVLAQYIVFPVFGRDSAAAGSIGEGLGGLLLWTYISPILVFILGIAGCVVSFVRGT